MAAVYRDATLGLFAITAAASTVDLLKPVPPSTSVQVLMRVFPATDGERKDEVSFSIDEKTMESFRRLYYRGPLWSRAWTLQEGKLSPRNLYFGNQRVYWKCNAADEATNGGAYGDSVPKSAFEELEIMIQDSAPNHHGAIRNREKDSWAATTDAMDPKVDAVATAFLQTAKGGSKYLLAAHTRRGYSYIYYNSDCRRKIRARKRRSETYKAIIIGERYGLVIASVTGHLEGARERKATSS